MFRQLIIATLAVGSACATAPALAHGTFCAQPFQHAGTVTVQVGYSGVVGQFPVPAGKRLQVEYVSAGLRMSTNEGRGAFAIGTRVNGVYASHPLPILTGYALSDRMTSSQVSLYADPGSYVSVEINRATGTNVAAVGRFVVTGCLYDV
ncbi:hypothetical protein E2F46_11085 [Luteimonas aestuarii]|uniref:Adhesin n=1 Tax=Luteimonas aestuarii TaxID=453837 RepID=A0A4R5TLM7_9GAMM|nr:hypothetical protein [Luteimonas aestuarii]TDK23456.1 hypothetical protein E2F46_11085 [Luteimonas aestuarii]